MSPAFLQLLTDCWCAADWRVLLTCVACSVRSFEGRTSIFKRQSCPCYTASCMAWMRLQMSVSSATGVCHMARRQMQGG